jgi:hypothetical protein
VVEEFEYRHGAGEGANEALTVEASQAHGPGAVIKIRNCFEGIVIQVYDTYSADSLN